SGAANGGATAADASSGATETADSVSAASEESAVHDAAYCLKCHGPFEALAERTKDYITEWDEKANPHVFVEHGTTTIVECAECHDPHPIPYEKVEGARKPNVSWCYSCHHAETLANCNTCHNE
ncbi:MAG TPA: cytochrome c3 family protein, partial [Rectinemataceae bacterium]